MTARRLLALGAAFALAGCRGADTAPTAPSSAPAAYSATADLHGNYRTPGAPLPVRELEAAQRATARYQDVRNAVADGYVDIGVVIKNMGRHFLKDSLLDATFDAAHPELLVYSPGAQGHLKLVAVEYAVPRNLSATAPEGFQGSADQWFDDGTFHLWTLHAWVWKNNPNGVFSPMNTTVP
jgi:hypothetical protein